MRDLRHVIAASLLAACAAWSGDSGTAGAAGLSPQHLTLAQGDHAMTMTLTSTAFTQEGQIPRRFTCDGRDVSPPLAWSGVPPETKSLVLIMDDPDAPDPAAPKMTWVHWVLYNIPADATELPEDVSAGDLPRGTREGLNSWDRTGYGGPCPPVGRHRYFHKLYALDTTLPDLGRPTKNQLERAIKGHVIARTELMATYQH